MDVDSLEQLGQTCSYFDQLINGKYLTSLNVPFDAHFLKEVSSTNTIEKKPLLKLKCPKSRESFREVYKDEPAKSQMMSQMSVDHVLSDNTSKTNTDYMIHLQLSFLSLEELREVDLLPEGLDEPDFDVSRSHNSFDNVIFRHLWLVEECD